MTAGTITCTCKEFIEASSKTDLELRIATLTEEPFPTDHI